MSLDKLPIRILFEEKSIKGAFGLSTSTPAVDKRPFGRWDPLSGDKFIKSKVGKVLHKPLFKDKTEKESLDEQVDPYQRKQQRRASLLKRYGYTGSPAPAPDANPENVEETGMMRKISTKIKRLNQRDAPWVSNKAQKEINRQQVAKGNTDVDRQKQLLKAEPRLRKPQYQAMVKHPNTGNMTPVLSPKGKEVVKRWETRTQDPYLRD